MSVFHHSHFKKSSLSLYSFFTISILLENYATLFSNIRLIVVVITVITTIRKNISVFICK